MIRTLMKSIREYKKPSLLAPILVSGEVVLECIIPFLIAKLVNEIKNGCTLEVIVRYGLVLVAMAALS
ncbi:MAG: ABC transporter ATP-binding protein, partial [Clostridiales bacterium]|nr:ABC transporter ATP-binding protein [Clostridiales bacterium]